MESKYWVPTFITPEGNVMVIKVRDSLCSTHEEAEENMLNIFLLAGLIMGLAPHEIIEIDPKDFPHYDGTRGGQPVMLIGGPLFEEKNHKES